jgi:hypothetical protein
VTSSVLPSVAVNRLWLTGGGHGVGPCTVVSDAAEKLTGLLDVSIGYAEGRVIEGRLLETDTVFGEGFEKGGDFGAVGDVTV